MISPSSQETITPDEANIVAIGGGSYRGTSKPHIETALNLAGVETGTNVLYVPSGKSQEVFDEASAKAREFFGESLGLNFDQLHGAPQEDLPDRETLQGKIDNADVIYVSGGNTPRLKEIWERGDIDTMLYEAVLMGKVVVGISVGGLIWFDRGYSNPNPREKTTGTALDFVSVKGLGLVDGMMAPHYSRVEAEKPGLAIDDRPRSTSLHEFIVANREQYVLGVDNGAALIVENGLARIESTLPESKVHLLGINDEKSVRRITFGHNGLQVPVNELRNVLSGADESDTEIIGV